MFFTLVAIFNCLDFNKIGLVYPHSQPQLETTNVVNNESHNEGAMVENPPTYSFGANEHHSHGAN